MSPPQRHPGHKRFGRKNPDYYSYLLRMWREDPQMPWHFSLENVQTDERQGFPDLEGLFAYLQAQTSVNSEQ